MPNGTRPDATKRVNAPRSRQRNVARTTGLTVLTVLAVALLAPGVATAVRCLPWDPDPVTLVGKLVVRSLPGPPGYRSIARGDNPEDIYFVELETPICVNEDLASSLPRDAHHDVREVQLSVSSTMGATLAALVGDRVRISGTLFSGNSGHYRTPVVLTVTSFRGG